MGHLQSLIGREMHLLVQTLTCKADTSIRQKVRQADLIRMPAASDGANDGSRFIKKADPSHALPKVRTRVMPPRPIEQQIGYQRTLTEYHRSRADHERAIGAPIGQNSSPESLRAHSTALEQ